MRYEGVSCVQVCVHRYYFVCVCAQKKKECVCSCLYVRVEIELWKSNSWLKTSTCWICCNVERLGFTLCRLIVFVHKILKISIKKWKEVFKWILVSSHQFKPLRNFFVRHWMTAKSSKILHQGPKWSEWSVFFWLEPFNWLFYNFP